MKLLPLVPSQQEDVSAQGRVENMQIHEVFRLGLYVFASSLLNPGIGMERVKPKTTPSLNCCFNLAQNRPPPPQEKRGLFCSGSPGRKIGFPRLQALDVESCVAAPVRQPTRHQEAGETLLRRNETPLQWQPKQLGSDTKNPVASSDPGRKKTLFGGGTSSGKPTKEKVGGWAPTGQGAPMGPHKLLPLQPRHC